MKTDPKTAAAARLDRMFRLEVHHLDPAQKAGDAPGPVTPPTVVTMSELLRESEAKLAAAEETLQSISVMLSDASCGPMPIPDGVQWLRRKIATLTRAAAVMEAKLAQVEGL